MMRELQDFQQMELSQFANLTAKLGFVSAAVYRLHQDRFIQVIDDGRLEHFPATFVDENFVHGWNSLPRDIKDGLGQSGALYLADHDQPRMAILVVGSGKAKKSLDAPLEIIAGRIARWISMEETRIFISQSSMEEQQRKVSSAISVLIDHELRTPLTAIIGYVSLLRMSKDNLDAGLALLDEQSQMALKSLDKISKIFHTPRQEPIPFDGLAILRSICDECVDWAKQQNREIKVVLQIPRDFESCFVRAVPESLTQAFREVIQNAMIYSDFRSVQVSAYPSDDQLVIDVQDQGEGLETGLEDLVFLQFFSGRKQSQVKRAHRGMGLGLYLARQIVEQSGGHLHYVKRKEKGSLFRFMMPIQQREAA